MRALPLLPVALLGLGHALAGPATVGATPVLRAAERALESGDAARALELYLGRLPRLAELAPEQRREVLEGALSACQALASGRRLEPARRGLQALLPAASGQGAEPLLAERIRLALEALAFDLLRAGQPVQAVEALTALMADGPGSAIRWALLARAHVESGGLERAEETLERGLQLHPDAPELLFVRAALTSTLAERSVARTNFAAAEGMLRRAEDDLGRAAGHEPRAAGIQRALGKIRAGLWATARATGRAREAEALLDAAERAYGEAMRLDPEDPEPAFELAELLEAAGDDPWAGRCFLEAERRHRALAGRPGAPAELRAAAGEQAQRCRQRRLRGLARRAFGMAGRFHHAEARALVEGALRLEPGWQAEGQALLVILEAQARRDAARIEALRAQADRAEAQVALGDLWAERGAWEAAEAAYARALDLGPAGLAPAELEARRYALRDLPAESHTHTFRIGELEVQLELPAGLEAGALRGPLERAHALTMAVFAHRLQGPLWVQVFANRRAWVERTGAGAPGRLLTFQDPRRGRAAWLDLLVRALTQRYVDELGYTHAPRWLREGLAQWVSQDLPAAREARVRELVRRGPLAWDRLEESFLARAGDPPALEEAYLQAQGMVAWLVRRHGLDRILVLLAGLRAGKPAEEALGLAFGQSARELERDFLAAFGGREP